LIIGGEGPLSASSVLSGEIVELAQANSALLIALEHRYYGNSTPFDTLSTENLQYLSSEQALSDIANFISAMTVSMNLTMNSWLVFGCSYSGALSAWFRLKFPQLTIASLASSAPVEATLSFYQYDQQIAASLGSTCANAIRSATQQIEAQLMLNSTVLKSQFGCSNVVNDIAFLYALADTVAFAVQYNSKYSGLQNTLCNMLSGGSIQNYVAYLTFIFGFTNTQCIDWDISSFTNETATINGNMRQWMYQSCEEFGFFQTAPANNSLRSSEITLQWHLDYVCQTLFGSSLAPNVAWTNANYGGNKIEASLILFTNGDMDPWRELSITASPRATLPTVNIAGAAHCANWYASNYTSDSTAVIQAREQIASVLANWIANPDPYPAYEAMNQWQTVLLICIVAVVCTIVGLLLGKLDYQFFKHLCDSPRANYSALN